MAPLALLLLSLASLAAAAKNLLRNPSFESSDIYIDPWTSDGSPGSYGINNPGKGTEAQDGRNFAYMVGLWEMGQQVLGVKAGEIYNVSYYAYSWAYAPADPNQLCGWQVGFGNEAQNANLTQVYNSTNLAPDAWPFFLHTFNASSSDLALSFTQENNTVFFIDHASVVCISCPAPDHTGQIVGGVIGGLAGVALLVLAGVWAWMRYGRARRTRGSDVGQEARFVSPPPTAASHGTGTYASYPTTTTPSSFGHSHLQGQQSTFHSGAGMGYPSRADTATSLSHPSSGDAREVTGLYPDQGGRFGGLPEVMEQALSPAQDPNGQPLPPPGGHAGYASYGGSDER